MDFFQTLKEIHLDPIIIILILAGGFWSKTYLKSWSKIGFKNWTLEVSNAWKTLIIGTVFSGLYVGIMHWTNKATPEIWTELFYSYIFATSFYELIIGPFSAWIKSKFTTNTP